MKALLIKDYLVIKKQILFVLIFIAVFSLSMYGSENGFFSIGFIVIISAMLPVTAIAYDERSKWNVLSATMPYSIKDIVLSKYLFGYLAVIIAGLTSILIQVIMQLVSHSFLGVESLVAIIAICLVSTVILSINIPLAFKFGVEKGRLLSIIVIVIFTVVVFSAIQFINSQAAEFINEKFWLFSLFMVILIIIINFVSAKISIKIKTV